MTRAFCYRAAMLAASLAVILAGLPARAPAALDMSIGAREVLKGTIDACNNAAKAALNSVLQNAAEAGETGQWEGYVSPNSADGSTAAAEVHCFPLGDSYVVTFTCAAQIPPYADSAAALCTKLNAAFDSNAH